MWSCCTSVSHHFQVWFSAKSRNAFDAIPKSDRLHNLLCVALEAELCAGALKSLQFSLPGESRSCRFSGDSVFPDAFPLFHKLTPVALSFLQESMVIPDQGDHVYRAWCGSTLFSSRRQPLARLLSPFLNDTAALSLATLICLLLHSQAEVHYEHRTTQHNGPPTVPRLDMFLPPAADVQDLEILPYWANFPIFKGLQLSLYEPYHGVFSEGFFPRKGQASTYHGVAVRSKLLSFMLLVILLLPTLAAPRIHRLSCHVKIHLVCSFLWSCLLFRRIFSKKTCRVLSKLS